MENNLQNAFKDFCSFDNSEFMKSSQFSNFMGALSFLVEQICNEDPQVLKKFLLIENSTDIFIPSPWIRLIIIQNIIYRGSDDKEFFEWASAHLRLFYHPQSPIILEIDNKFIS